MLRVNRADCRKPVNFAGIICFLTDSRYIPQMLEYELRIAL